MPKNLYEEHMMMIDSGRFWRCDHGLTGVSHACWECGQSYPHKFVRHLFDTKKYYVGDAEMEVFEKPVTIEMVESSGNNKDEQVTTKIIWVSDVRPVAKKQQVG